MLRVQVPPYCTTVHVQVTFFYSLENLQIQNLQILRSAKNVLWCTDTRLATRWRHCSASLHPPLAAAAEPQIGRVAHIFPVVTGEHTRVGFDCLVPHTTQLIKLLLRSRWDAVHLFNSIHHIEPRRCGFTRGTNGHSPNGFKFTQLGTWCNARASTFDFMIYEHVQITKSPLLWKLSIRLIGNTLDGMCGLGWTTVAAIRRRFGA